MEVMDHAASLSSDLPIIIAGDFNTKAHGVARLSPWYCGDWMRVGSIGNTESEVNPSPTPSITPASNIITTCYSPI